MSNLGSIQMNLGPKRISPSELIDILNVFPDDEYEIDEDGVLLEEEMRKLNTRAYVPVGRLHLPVAYKISHQGDGKKPIIGLITVFNNEFLENPAAFYNERTGFSYNLDNLLDHVKGAMQKDDLFIETKSDNATGIFLLMGQHIPKFIRLYDSLKTEPADTISKQCIRRCFVDYRGQR